MPRQLQRAICILCVICGYASAQAGVFMRGADSPPQIRTVVEILQVEGRGIQHGADMESTGLPSCFSPSPAGEEICALQARRILDSVVRIELEGPNRAGEWTSAVGHGTVVSGRYLLTHNHFTVSPGMFEDMANTGQAALSLVRADGRPVLTKVPPTIYKVVSVGQASLVLDFGADASGQGFFERRGLASAALLEWEELGATGGLEVAQVNWDGSRSRVDWVRVLGVYEQDGVPRLVLENGLAPGASGGGVFWRGYHIAVNWMNLEVVSREGVVIRRYSAAALNTSAAAMVGE